MRIKLFYALMASLALAVLGGLHGYLWLRLVADPLWGPVPAAFGAGVVVAMGAAIPLSFAGERLVPPPFGKLLVWPGAVWLGLAWLLLALLALSDVGLALAGLLADPVAARIRALTVLGLGALGGVIGMRSALRLPPVISVTLALERWPAALNGYRFAQLSDLHVGPLLGTTWLERVIRRVNAIDADCVVVTGDLIDGPPRFYASQLQPFTELRARHGAWCVIGNHELYSSPRSWLPEFERVGLRVLGNAHATLGEGDAAFDLAGTHDRQGYIVALAEDLDAALADRDPSRPVVLLAHTPTTFPDAAARGVDLTLSGHTHGGQIWPFGLLVKVAVRFIAGVYRRGSSQLYVSRGTGFWGPPMRLGAPAEITEITVVSADL